MGFCLTLVRNERMGLKGVKAMKWEGLKIFAILMAAYVISDTMGSFHEDLLCLFASND